MVRYDASIMKPTVQRYAPGRGVASEGSRNDWKTARECWPPDSCTPLLNACQAKDWWIQKKRNWFWKQCIPKTALRATCCASTPRTFLLESCSKQISDPPTCTQTDRSTGSPKITKELKINAWKISFQQASQDSGMYYSYIDACEIMDGRRRWKHLIALLLFHFNCGVSVLTSASISSYRNCFLKVMRA